jgi:hypothetical protein
MARTTEGDAQQWLKAQLQGEGYDLTAVESLSA